MKTPDFTCSITAKVTAEEALDAISHVDQWWAKTFEGSAQHLNDVFTVRFGTTYVTFCVSELIPATKVVWTVTDSHLPWQKDITEWTGTKVIYQIVSGNGTTTINFTHQGLQPGVECYNQCVKGWTEHLTESLQKLLSEGVGEPA
ncbi:SRPBCC domain-containing protein [Mucilaginibacter sp. AW1-3]